MTRGTPRPPEPPKSSKSEPQQEMVPAEHSNGEHKHHLIPAARLVAGAVLTGLAGAYLLGRNKKQEDES
jgi:hypothetical protein